MAAPGSTPLDAADGALLDAVRALQWPARRRAPGGLAGDHLSRVVGGAAEFTEYRAYRQGDDPSRLDWKLLARSNRAYIRLSQERTVLPTMLLVDASASLAYPADTQAKWHHARRLALGLAAVAHRGADPVGVVVASGDDAVRLPPRTRRSAVQDIARLLGSTEPAGRPDLATHVAALRAAGRLVVIGDFLGVGDDPRQDALLAAMAQLCAAGREVHAVHVVHTTERTPDARDAIVMDPMQPDVRRPLVPATRRRYVEAFAEWRLRLGREVRRSGALHVEVVTDEPAAHAVRRIVSSGTTAAVRA